MYLADKNGTSQDGFWWLTVAMVTASVLLVAISIGLGGYSISRGLGPEVFLLTVVFAALGLASALLSARRLGRSRH